MDLEILRHSCSHIMAQAVKELWPEVKLAIGPAIEDGFYYDFDKSEPFSPDDLLKIEEKMQQIIKENLAFSKEELNKNEAIKLFEKLKESYKIELIKEIPDQSVSIYKTGNKFVDLCRGPHIRSTEEVKFFKLLSCAGAYWRGLETNPMLQRIYGTCFETKEDLENYLKVLEEAKLRDHRKIGKELEFFDIFYEEAGAGLVFYYPKGAILRTLIEDYEKKEHLKRGYQIVITPHIMQQGLWQKSGHYDYYRENMYTFKIPDDKSATKRGGSAENRGGEFVLKPMNCPGHILIYKSKTRSYKDLPLRLFELGTVYRHEKSGVLHGLLRVRGFTQDDAHIFCLPEQLKEEIKNIIDFVIETMRVFGFSDFEIDLSTQPEKFIGNQTMWDKATAALKESLEEKNLKFNISPGEGAFYGPKIDIKLKDALKRLWQCATIQCDFALPERFDLNYIDDKGQKQCPVMLHRVLLGSLERFIGALLEHYAGDFPLWLSPEQVRIIPLTSAQENYAQNLKNTLIDREFRATIDNHNETLQKRIREAELEKVPYVLVVGKKEVEQNKISVRKRHSQDLGQMSLDDFINLLNKEV